MNIIVCMEESQVMQQAFAAEGHTAYSCDLKPARVDPRWHIQGDVFETLRRRDLPHWNGAIFHPVCRYLSVSGQHWIGKPKHENRAQLRDEAVQDFMRCVQEAERFEWAIIENPVGIMSTLYREPDQYIQPYQFGDDASKKTGLWLFGAARGGITFDPAKSHPGRLVEWPRGSGKIVRRWSNQTDSGQNRLAPTKNPEDRRAARAETYPGPAKAIAKQSGGWGIR